MELSQAISGEIVFEMLLGTLMRSSRRARSVACLTLARGAARRIGAEATTNGNMIFLRLFDEPMAETRLPL